MTPFFITGLPRSRTAWLANYFSYGNTVCLHDLLHRLTIYEIGGRILKTGCANGGYADPALLLYWEAILEDVPAAKWLIVERDIEDVARTWDQVIGQDSTPELYAYKQTLEGLKRRAGRVLTVEFEDLNSRLDEIERFLAPGFQCPGWRREMLLGLNVQKTPRMIKDEMETLWAQD